jgi:hypothetical protein
MAVSTIDPNGLNVGQFGNRNLIINGAMQVAQRGTSETGVNVGTFHTVDRFQYAEGSGGGSGALTESQSTEAPDGFANSFKFEVTTTDTLSGGENVLVRTRLEGQDLQRFKFGTSAAEKMTVSFFVRASETGTYGLQIMIGPASNESAMQSYTVNSANTWEYKTITFDGSTSYSIPNNSSRGFDLNFMLDCGPDDLTSPYGFTTTGAFRAPTGQVNFMQTSGNTWQITGLQLEVGDTATPFEHISFGDQLQKCRRYFYNLQSAGVYTRFGVGENINASVVQCFIDYPIEMRVKPSLVTSGIPSVYALYHSSSITACTSIALDAYTTTHTGVIAAGVSGTPLLDGGASQLMANNNSSTFLAFDAEL